MGWKDLLQKENEYVDLPWTGGGLLYSDSRTFRLVDRPQEFGWYRFSISGKTANNPRQTEPVSGLLKKPVTGYVVGDRLIHEGVRIGTDPGKLVEHSGRVHLLPDGLERFSRIRAGKIYPEGPLIFLEPAFPLGPEDEVMDAYLDNRASGSRRGIPHGVLPAIPGRKTPARAR